MCRFSKTSKPVRPSNIAPTDNFSLFISGRRIHGFIYVLVAKLRPKRYADLLFKASNYFNLLSVDLHFLNKALLLTQQRLIFF